ncbi:hypothetical protein Pelo_16774 [Pelomyxa schiedti]|nr:hypothetical protein Pelo_16774 [Pelomyxa schiedti]
MLFVYHIDMHPQPHFNILDHQGITLFPAWMMKPFHQKMMLAKSYLVHKVSVSNNENVSIDHNAANSTISSSESTKSTTNSASCADIVNVTVPILEKNQLGNNSGSPKDWLKIFRHHVTISESLPGSCFRQDDFQDEGYPQVHEVLLECQGLAKMLQPTDPQLKEKLSHQHKVREKKTTKTKKHTDEECKDESWTVDEDTVTAPTDGYQYWERATRWNSAKEVIMAAELGQKIEVAGFEEPVYLVEIYKSITKGQEDAELKISIIEANNTKPHKMSMSKITRTFTTIDKEAAVYGATLWEKHRYRSHKRVVEEGESITPSSQTTPSKPSTTKASPPPNKKATRNVSPAKPVSLPIEKPSSAFAQVTQMAKSKGSDQTLSTTMHLCVNSINMRCHEEAQGWQQQNAQLVKLLEEKEQALQFSAFVKLQLGLSNSKWNLMCSLLGFPQRKIAISQCVKDHSKWAHVSAIPGMNGAFASCSAVFLHLKDNITQRKAWDLHGLNHILVMGFIDGRLLWGKNLFYGLSVSSVTDPQQFYCFGKLPDPICWLFVCSSQLS